MVSHRDDTWSAIMVSDQVGQRWRTAGRYAVFRNIAGGGSDGWLDSGRIRSTGAPACLPMSGRM